MVNVVVRDFRHWRPREVYDLVLCSQVLEHQKDPSDFLRRLLAMGRLVLVSVPHRQPDRGGETGHQQNDVALDDVRAWAGVKELYSYASGGRGSQRLLVVFGGHVDRKADEAQATALNVTSRGRAHSALYAHLHSA